MLWFRQYYLGCLSHASYLVGDTSTGRAVVVDPQRDIAQYLADAEAHGLRIERVIETHFHADFLSGHLELARATGAEIGVGAAGQPEFAHRSLHDGERIELGDVGRPDLLASVGVTADELGRSLYHSLRNQFLTLPDDTKVFPAHGAGSACGKQLSTETVSTIGEQRATNYALAAMLVAEFLSVVTEGQPAAPGYFSYDAQLNKSERLVFDEAAPAAPLRLDEVLAHQARGAVVIDTRDAATFAAGHLSGSINVALDGRFAEFAGSVAQPSDTLVVVTEPGDEREARVRLARIGFDRLAGFLAEPYRQLVEHPELMRQASRLTAEEFVRRCNSVPGLRVIDVRTHGEHSLGSVPGADVVPVAELRDEVAHLSTDLDAPVVVFCAGGYRSSLAASLLRAHGFTDVSDVLGGYGACEPLLTAD